MKMESAHAPTLTFTNPPPTPPNQQQASMPVDHVRQVFAMSHVCRAAREGVRGVGGLPAMRISGAREDLLEHMRRVWPRLRFAIDMNGCNVEQFWAVELPKHHACVVEVRAGLLYPFFSSVQPQNACLWNPNSFLLGFAPQWYPTRSGGLSRTPWRSPNRRGRCRISIIS